MNHFQTSNDYLLDKLKQTTWLKSSIIRESVLYTTILLATRCLLNILKAAMYNVEMGITFHTCVRDCLWILIHDCLFTHKILNGKTPEQKKEIPACRFWTWLHMDWIKFQFMKRLVQVTLMYLLFLIEDL